MVVDFGITQGNKVPQLFWPAIIFWFRGSLNHLKAC